MRVVRNVDWPGAVRPRDHVGHARGHSRSRARMAFASFLDAAKHPPPARAVPREGHETSNPRHRGRAYRARGARNGELINRTRSEGCPHATRPVDETHFE